MMWKRQGKECVFWEKRKKTKNKEEKFINIYQKVLYRSPHRPHKISSAINNQLSPLTPPPLTVEIKTKLMRMWCVDGGMKIDFVLP